MPSSIPYDPRLSLMSVVTETTLKNVAEVAEAQAPAEAAKDALNSLIASKRGLTMTKIELRNLGVGTDSLDRELSKLDQAVDEAAARYASAKIVSEARVTQLKEQLRAINKSIESHVDYMRSEIKTMPLAADTMNMDVQYFSFDSSAQNPASYSAQIGAYVSSSAGSIFGQSVSDQLSASVSRQVSSQISTQTIEGTLVLSVSCTHKHASIVAPFALHVDKAVKVWNQLFPADKLDPTDGSSMMKAAMSESQEDQKKFSIVSGQTFGSAFVGMVHILRSINTSTSDSLDAAALSLRSIADAGSWFAKAEGNVGVDKRFASGVKELLSQQSVQSKVALLNMGVIPYTPENAVTSSVDNKTGESDMSAVAVMDGEKNKSLNTESMMTALDDYLKKAAEGNGGVPINYYLKDVDKKMLAQMWAAKYYPGKFMSIKYDDAEAEIAV